MCVKQAYDRSMLEDQRYRQVQTIKGLEKVRGKSKGQAIGEKNERRKEKK